MTGAGASSLELILLGLLLAQVGKVVYNLMHFYLAIVPGIAALLRWRIFKKGLQPRGYGPTKSGSLAVLLPPDFPQRPWEKF